MSAGRTKLVVGLGNPGDKYLRNWHNLGYMALDILAQRNGLEFRRLKFKGYLESYNFAGNKVLLLKPTTFMNNSGQSVREAMDFYHLDLADLIVIYDDIDLNLGDLRIRAQGGAAHHNGMKSVIQHLGSQNFTRIRVGFGPQDRTRDIVDQVLADIPKRDQDLAFQSLTRAADAVELIIKDGLTQAQSRLNGPVDRHGS